MLFIFWGFLNISCDEPMTPKVEYLVVPTVMHKMHGLTIPCLRYSVNFLADRSLIFRKFQVDLEDDSTGIHLLEAKKTN